MIGCSSSWTNLRSSSVRIASSSTSSMYALRAVGGNRRLYDSLASGGFAHLGVYFRGERQQFFTRECDRSLQGALVNFVGNFGIENGCVGLVRRLILLNRGRLLVRLGSRRKCSIVRRCVGCILDVAIRVLGFEDIDRGDWSAVGLLNDRDCWYRNFGKMGRPVSSDGSLAKWLRRRRRGSLPILLVGSSSASLDCVRGSFRCCVPRF